MLDREEYVEQAYLFRTLRERMQQSMSTQDLLDAIRQEILTTTMLPYAVEFMASELRLTGGFATAMARLPHYFTPFQTYVIAEAEKAEGMFDFRIGLEILEAEAEYRAKEPTLQGMFLFQFEALCRNRLGYERGLEAVAGDEIYNGDWREWICFVNKELGLIDFADMIYMRSAYYEKTQKPTGRPVLFGEKEGRIAAANRRKDPLFLFSALQRQLGYPKVPEPKPEDTNQYLLPALQARLERLEMRVGIMDEELRGGINLGQYYKKE